MPPGRQSHFNNEQEEHIKGHFPEFVAKVHELDPDFQGINTGVLTRWKKEKTNEILSNPLFKDTMPPGAVSEWTTRIMRKFTNHVSTMKRKAQPTHPTNLDQIFKIAHEITARQLFEQEHKDEINAIATQRRQGSADGSMHAGLYQTALKEMWRDEPDHEEYERRARELATNVPQNQQEFMKAAWLSLKALCQNGKLGPAEMMLFFAFRDEEGDIDGGVINAHSIHNTKDMKSEIKDFKEQFEVPWIEFAERVLPRPSQGENTIEIPNNSAGVPVFPNLDLNKVTLDGIRATIKKYFTLLWDQTWPKDCKVTATPWVEIYNNPSDYYDTIRFALPVRLQSPEHMSPANLFILAEYLATSMSSEANDPFTFRSKAEIIQRHRDHDADEEGLENGVEPVEGDGSHDTASFQCRHDRTRTQEQVTPVQSDDEQDSDDTESSQPRHNRKRPQEPVTPVQSDGEQDSDDTESPRHRNNRKRLQEPVTPVQSDVEQDSDDTESSQRRHNKESPQEPVKPVQSDNEQDSGERDDSHHRYDSTSTQDPEELVQSDNERHFDDSDHIPVNKAS